MRVTVARALAACTLVITLSSSVSAQAPSTARGTTTPAPTAGAASPSAAAQGTPPRQNPDRAADWAYLKRYQAANAALPAPSAGTKRVVFMGDSITQNWAEQRPSFFDSHGYVGRGISGQTTSQMVLRFHQDVVALEPTVVAILAGTNDVAENTGPVTDAQVIDNLDAMVEMARAHGMKVVVGSVPPATYFFWRKEVAPNPRISELNAKIKAWAQAQKIPYADYWAAMSAPDGTMNPKYAEDSVHPNAEGYAVMEPIVQAAIAEALKGGR